jgi:hypothetical protein
MLSFVSFAINCNLQNSVFIVFVVFFSKTSAIWSCEVAFSVSIIVDCKENRQVENHPLTIFALYPFEELSKLFLYVLSPTRLKIKVIKYTFTANSPELAPLLSTYRYH